MEDKLYTIGFMFFLMSIVVLVIYSCEHPKFGKVFSKVVIIPAGSLSVLCGSLFVLGCVEPKQLGSFDFLLFFGLLTCIFGSLTKFCFDILRG